MLTQLIAYVRGIARRRRADAEAGDELSFHLEQEIQDGVARGLSPTEARRVALRDLGGLTQTREAMREVRLTWLDALWRDARYALRGLLRNPGFTVVAVTTLALGIGANTAIFSVSDVLLLRPLPYPDADRLVALRSVRSSSVGPDDGLTSPLDLADWQAHATSFEAMTGYRWRTVDLTGGAYSERLNGLWATPEFFRVFGIAQLNGRTFTPADRGTNTIILGREVWERRFASDRSLIGSMLDINIINLSRVGATPHLVLGAVPVDVHFPPLTADFNHAAITDDVSNVDARIDFWSPLFLDGDPRRDDRALDVVAKLRPGITPARAQADMDAIALDLANKFPATNRDRAVRVVPLRSQIVGGARRVILLLSCATVLVLVIACGNVSTLLLARGLTREREVAVRSAMGASRLQIARQFLIEALVIALAAAVLGVGLAAAGLRLLGPWFPVEVPLIDRAGINASVLAFAIAGAAMTACLTGVVPAWLSSRHDARAMNLQVRGQSVGRWQRRAISGLVAVQVAATLVLLVSTGLLLKSAAHLWEIDPGFSPTNVLTMTISLPNNKFDWQHNVVFSREVMSAVKVNPVVMDAAVIQGVPMQAGGFWVWFSVDGMPPTPTANLPVARQRVISPGYFRVMQIPLIDGRDFDERDSVGERGHPKFVIVSRALAGRYWPGRSAVGERLQMLPAREWVTVAGVVGDVRYTGLDTPPNFEIYLPEGLFPQSAITLLVKTMTSPRLAVADIRARIAQVDREAFVTDARTMDDLIVGSLASRWFATLLLTLCGGVGLVLSLCGIYGIVAQTVVQQRFEIGVRMALGATTTRVVGQMLRRSVSPVAVGAIVGLLVTFVSSRLLSAMLFGVRPFDPATFAAATGLFVLVALVAAFLPARRATRVDPLVALRAE